MRLYQICRLGLTPLLGLAWLLGPASAGQRTVIPASSDGAAEQPAKPPSVLDMMKPVKKGAPKPTAPKDTSVSAEPPPIAREFRAAWIASVANIDWPSHPGLPVERQKQELIAILDRAAALHLNALILQVRPACDALYDSKLEPWSEYLTGRMGQAPEPYYDPLAFAVTEAHRRGLELHAWFNPYRARHSAAKSPVSETHISRSRPELVRHYGNSLWLDPGEKAVQAHSRAVILDVVRRYDIDGVHLDDYFYPYKEKGPDGHILPFPDDPSWQRYKHQGGTLDRDNWRRENVNEFIRDLYQDIKREKRWVKFGISPFGIWRPGHPAQIHGFDQYTELYADARKWLREGWLDYFTPQLYWKIDPPAQSFPALLNWWVGENVKGRNIWPGSYTSLVRVAGNWPSSEIVRQIECTRKQPGATGNVHFSMKALMSSGSEVGDVLRRDVYAVQALVPPSPWLSQEHPLRPAIRIAFDSSTQVYSLEWSMQDNSEGWLWIARSRRKGVWSTQIYPAGSLSMHLNNAATGLMLPDAVSVTAINRYGNESEPSRLDGNVLEQMLKDSAE